MANEKRKELAEKGRRTVPVTFYVSHHVKKECEEMAKLAQMTPSRFFGAIAERLVQSGFAIAGFARIGMQLHARLKEIPEHERNQQELKFWNPFEKMKPLPFAKEREEPLTAIEADEIISELEALIQTVRSRVGTPEEAETTANVDG
jgi:hypothetical protein